MLYLLFLSLSFRLQIRIASTEARESIIELQISTLNLLFLLLSFFKLILRGTDYFQSMLMLSSKLLACMQYLINGGLSLGTLNNCLMKLV